MKGEGRHRILPGPFRPVWTFVSAALAPTVGPRPERGIPAVRTSTIGELSGQAKSPGRVWLRKVEQQ